MLKSEKAIEINIGIMRAFALLRELTIGYTDLKRRFEEFQLDTTLRIAEIFDIINAMAEKQKAIDKPRKQIGFRKDNDNRK